MDYQSANEAKASFDDVYTAPTPHNYVAAMARNGYQIGEQARPYCAAAAELLKQQNGDAWPVQMLDVACSYGLGGAFVKYGCSFDEVVAFYASRAPTEYESACESTRMWLNVVVPACDMRCVGLDSSEPAIRFALDAGLLDGGIALDFENGRDKPSADERAWFASCNLLICTGGVGYVTEKTFDYVLRDFGRDYPGNFGPFAVMTVLRVFDVEPIQSVFGRYGYAFESVPGARLPQRRFASEEERQKMVAQLHDQQIDTRDWEDQGKLYADLYVAAPAGQLAALQDAMQRVHSGNGSEPVMPGFIHR